MNKRIIFLDIDGVVQPEYNRQRFEKPLDNEHKQLINENPDIYTNLNKYDIGAARYDWHPEAIEYLRILCEECEAKIVISSEWRRSHTLLQMKTLFGFHNLSQEIIDFTAILEYTATRLTEIQQYLEEQPEIENFVIIDDSFYNTFVNALPYNFVYSDSDYIKESHFVRAKNILSGKEVEPLKPSKDSWL